MKQLFVPHRNTPVSAGDLIQSIVKLEGGGEMFGTVQVVKSVDSEGTPYVRYRFGKVDKPILHWIKIERVEEAIV